MTPDPHGDAPVPSTPRDPEPRARSALERRTQHGIAAQGRAQQIFTRLHLPRAPMLWLAILGPGLIAANAGNDAGGVVTYAQAGAKYGYALLWVMLVITLSLAVVQEMCGRMGAVTGKGLSDLVREQFGIRWTLFITLALFVANAGTAFSEFIGIATAMELLHVTRYIAVPVAAIVLWLLVVRGSYKSVERIFLVMGLAFLAYPISAFINGPNWLQVGKATILPTLKSDPAYLQVLIALVGTTVTPYMQIYVQSAVAEKGITERDYPLERLDIYSGTIFGNLISAFIIIATGSVLFMHGHGVDIGSAADAARALEPVAGSGAKVLFAVGLLGASLLAAAVLPLTTAYSVTEAFGFEKGVSFGFTDAPVFMGIFTGLIALGALIALVPGLPIVQVLIVIQVVNGLLLPVVLIAALRLCNDRELMGRFINGRVFNSIAIATIGFVIALSSAYLLVTLLKPFGISFG